MADTAPQQARPERVGRKGVMTYVPDEMGTRLKVIAAERHTTIQKIGEIAFSHWLALYKADADSALNIDPPKIIRTDKPLRKTSKTTGPTFQ